MASGDCWSNMTGVRESGKRSGEENVLDSQSFR